MVRMGEQEYGPELRWWNLSIKVKRRRMIKKHDSKMECEGNQLKIVYNTGLS
jgi:hypothetical protein